MLAYSGDANAAEIQQSCQLTLLQHARSSMPRDTIKSLAKEIQARWPDLVVRTWRSHTDTDRKIRGTRLRRPGKGRYGTRILVQTEDGWTLLDHDNSETYRTTAEVRHWIEEYAKKRGQP